MIKAIAEACILIFILPFTVIIDVVTMGNLGKKGHTFTDDVINYIERNL